MRKALGLAFTAWLIHGIGAASPALDGMQPFLGKYCYDCHGAEKQKGDYRFDTLGSDLSEIETLETWQAILDQLNLGEMPPKKATQPSIAEVEAQIDPLSAALTAAYAKARSTGGETVLRRLNRHELRNTFRDLLYLNGADYRPDASGSRLTDNNGNGSVERSGTDPLRFFPEDEQEDGFFNLGDQLVTSDFFLKLTLDAVQEVLTQATHLQPKPAVEPRQFGGHMLPGNSGHVIERVSREHHADYDLMATGYENRGRLSPHDLRGGVGVAARYRISVEVSAHNPNNPWAELFEIDPEGPFLFGVNIADTKNGGLAGVTSTPLDLWAIPADGKKHTFHTETWIDRTWTPWIGWENGPTEKQVRAETIVEKFMPKAFFKRPDKQVDKEAHESWHLDMARLLVKDGYRGPHLRVHKFTIEPLIEQWPPRSHAALYGSESGEEKEIRTLLHTFARRAFRRPVTEAEVEPFVQLVLSEQIEPVTRLANGIRDLRYRLYEGKWSKLPDFDALKPVAEGALPGQRIDIGVTERKDYFGMVFEGKIDAPRAGEYLFEIASDDGGRLLVDGKTVVEHDGLHGATLKKGKITLEPGEHDIRVEYFAYGAPNSLRAGWTAQGSVHVPLSKDPVHTPKAAKTPKDTLPRYIRAMQNGYAAMLCSPQFLYLKEPSGRLDNHALAARLSYFLWSSMPDESLLKLADSGRLRDPAVLRSQTERMIYDPKAAALIRHFPSAWLRMDKLGKMPPSGGDFQFYKNLRVEPMLMAQVTHYFEHVLGSNGGIEQFIDSKHTYMNQVLAKWIYRREDIRGARLRQVALDDPKRGGIFTLPGLMTATANGVDTSPVIRGTWVLESILGTPPSPPPPDVEPLPTDTREATSIRELLALHRENAACNSCHVKIDPMGYAFENFDVVGRWRDKYKRARDPIDTSATLSDGRQVADIVEFKQMLIERKQQVARCLTEKMLTYATGRHLEVIDRGEIDRILKELEPEGYRLRDLIHQVVQSEIFLSK